MIRKKIASSKLEVVNSSFPINTKFAMNSQNWEVTESFIQNNTEMRRILAEDGTDEILTLVTLARDAEI